MPVWRVDESAVSALELSLVLMLYILWEFFIVGTRAQEAHEAPECSQALAAWENGGCLGPKGEKGEHVCIECRRHGFRM